MTRHTVIGIVLTFALVAVGTACEQAPKESESGKATAAPPETAAATAAPPATTATTPTDKKTPEGAQPKKDPEVTKPAPSDPSATAQAQPADPPAAMGDALLGSYAAFARLPGEEVLFAAVTPNFVATLDALGRNELKTEFVEFYEKAVQELVQELGRNLLEPEELTKMGVDLSQPVGFFLMYEETGGVSFALSNRETFKNALYEMAAKENAKLDIKSFGDALYLYPKNDPEAGFILFEKLAIAFVDDRSDELALATAERIATLAPEKSLQHNAAFKSVAGRLGGGHHAEAYVNLESLVMFEQTARAQRSERSIERMKKRLAEAQQQKDPGNDVNRISEDLKWEEESLTRRKERVRKAQAAVDTILGADSAIGLGLKINGPSIELAMHTHHPGALNTLLQPVDGAPLVFSTLAKTPMFAVHGKMDPLAALKTLYGMEPRAQKEIEGELAKEFDGLSLEKDILAHTTGEVGFALHFDINAARDNAQKPWEERKREGLFADITLWIGVKDTQAAKTTLTRIMAHKDLAKRVKANGDGWIVDLDPKDVKPFHVAITNDAVAISTDTATFDALKKGGAATDFRANITQAEHKRILGVEKSAAVLHLSSAATWMVFMDGGGMGKGEAWAKPKSAAPSKPLTPEQVKLKAELEKQLEAHEVAAEAERKTLRKAIEDKEFAMSQRIGDQALQCNATPQGWDCTGGFFFLGTSIPQILTDTIKEGLALEKENRARWKRDDELEEQRREIERKLSEVSGGIAMPPRTRPVRPGSVIDNNSKGPVDFGKKAAPPSKKKAAPPTKKAPPTKGKGKSLTP